MVSTSVPDVLSGVACPAVAEHGGGEIELTMVTMTFDAADAGALQSVLGKYVVVSRGHAGCRNIDLALSKRTRIAGRFNLELKAEAFNLTNSVSFTNGDENINSATFGQITGVAVGSRVMQFSARFDF